LNIGNINTIAKQYNSDDTGGDEGRQDTVNPDFIEELFNSPTGILTVSLMFGVIGTTIIYLFMRKNRAENKTPVKIKDKPKKISLKQE